MKKTSILGLAIIAMVAMVSCNSSKIAINKTKNIEGEKVSSVTTKLSGIEMADALSEDGGSIVKKAYKWYSGIGKADDKQVAIEMAQREAYATISRVVSNIVADQSERANLVNGGKVQQAVNQYWKQVSESILKGCEPFGETTLQYNGKMYEAFAKVAMRGDKYNKLIDQAADYKPTGLSVEELDQFIEVNRSIISAAKGN